MRRGTARAAGPLTLLVVLGTAGCVGPSTDPVPTTAEAPFLCDGVPREGVELMTGLAEPEAEQAGDRSDPEARRGCAVRDDDGETVLNVSWRTIDGLGVGSPEEYLETLAGDENATPIEADASGGGYVIGPQDQPAGYWVCDDSRWLLVELFDGADGRDGFDDVARFVESVLPWTCGGEDFPEAEES